MATVLSSGQNGGCVSLKALHGQCALSRSQIDFGKVCWAELHPSDKVSCSVLCTKTQMQAYHWAVITTALQYKCAALNQWGAAWKKRLMLGWLNSTSFFDLTENKGTQSYFSVCVLANTVRVVPLKSRSAVVPPIDEVNSWVGFNELNFMSVTESPAPI